MSVNRWLLPFGFALAGACASANQNAPSTTSFFGQADGSAPAEPPVAQRSQGDAMPHEACVDGGGDLDQRDVNGDGRADIRTVRRGGTVFCRETDANFDGRVDIIRFFDEMGRPRRVEDDYDFDGRIDIVATYANGVLVSDLLDTNFDGRIDTWRDYQSGKIQQLRRDANSDGRVDTWQDYDAQGEYIGTALDLDGDGQPDGAPPDPASGDGGVGAGGSEQTTETSDAGVTP